MNLASFFMPLKQQQDYILQLRIKSRRDEILKEAIEKPPNFTLETDEQEMAAIYKSIEEEYSCADNQLHHLKMIAKETWKGSRKFDIDFSSSSKTSNFDKMVKHNILQKSLENDNLIVVEGSLDQAQDWFTSEMIKDDRGQ